MKLSKPSLAARAIAQLVDGWPTFAHGESLSGNLSLAGFTVLNHGNFASVVEGKPGQVIKVFSLKDLGYQLFVDYILEHASVHHPVIHSFAKSGRYGIIELERLEHKVMPAIAVSNYLDRVRSQPLKIKPTWGLEFQEAVLNLNTAVKKHNTASKMSVTWDCHEDNVMFRDQVPILSDVLYCEEL